MEHWALLNVRSLTEEDLCFLYESNTFGCAKECQIDAGRAFAKRIGANKSYISRIEKGITVPSVATFYRIINALGLTIELKPAFYDLGYFCNKKVPFHLFGSGLFVFI